MTQSNHHHQRLVRAALASALALGLGGPAQAHKAKGDQEKCYGVAKAGQNDCANLGYTHDCAGEADADHAPDEWQWVASGTCKKLKGMSEAEAQAKFDAAVKARTAPKPAAASKTSAKPAARDAG